MASESLELESSPAVRFHDCTWKTRTVVVGLGGLLVWRLSPLLDRPWLELIPWWLSVILLGVTPQAFLLLFPLLTRSPRGRLYFPTVKRFCVEFGIAALVVIGIILAMGVTSLVLDRLWPGTSLTPEALQQLAETGPPWLVFSLLTFAFTFAPIAEEVFFRGFLQNAFSARMPVVVATLLQASIFGAIHFFGVTHSIAAAIMGLILTAIYRWRQTLVTPILVHAGTNFVSAVGIAALAIASADRPLLGVAGGPEDTSCVVRQIVPDSAAEKAGLQVGDVIVKFGGQEVEGARQLVELVRRQKAGDTVPVTIDRAGIVVEINVVLQRRGGP